MKNTISILAFATAILSLQSCAPKTGGEGSVVTNTRNAGNFGAIHTSLDADVYFTQSATYSVVLEGQQNILDLIKTRVSGDELDIDYERGARVGRHEPVVIRISGPRFTGWSISGSGSMSGTNAIAVPGSNVKLRISGSGSINIPSLVCNNLITEISGAGNIAVNGGTADKIDSRISGSGSTNLVEVAAQTGSIHISGSGDEKVWAANNLDVHISGSGNVVYRGHPSMSTAISGSGKLRQY